MPFTFLIYICFIIGLVLVGCWVFLILVRKFFNQDIAGKIIEWAKVVGVILCFGAMLKVGLEG